jgi:protein ImuA
MPANPDILAQLQREILALQGSRPLAPGATDLGLGPITAAFPNNTFPTGAIHELISPRPETAPATSGFTSALVSGLMRSGGACIWVSSSRKIYPPGLKAFGIQPDRVIFMDMKNEKEVLWATEEALKCNGLAAVVGDIRELTMTASRRFQLAVEQSRVTGFVLRQQPRHLHPTAAVARWQITPLPSEAEPGMPGLGFPRWNIELTRIRNGHPGSWQTEWQAGRFHFNSPPVEILREKLQRKTG